MRSNTGFRVVVQHPKNEIFEFQIVRDRVAGFAQTTTAGAAQLDTQYVGQFSGGGRFVLLADIQRIRGSEDQRFEFNYITYYHLI